MCFASSPDFNEGWFGVCLGFGDRRSNKVALIMGGIDACQRLLCQCMSPGGGQGNPADGFLFVVWQTVSVVVHVADGILGVEVSLLGERQ